MSGVETAPGGRPRALTAGQPSGISRLEHLDALVAVADALGATRTAAEGRRLVTRLRQGRFYVACIGQFKRGKSTLLNALVGQPVLPTGVTPVTSVVTVLQYGERSSADVQFADGTIRAISLDEVEQYVTERLNPRNRQGVALVAISLPHEALAAGLCLVDTPGIGSVFAANTDTTRAFVPQLDAAIVVLGADPPLSGDELAVIRDVSGRVDHLVVVLNKADRVSQADQIEAADFAERVLAEQVGRAVGPLLRVSATERLAGQMTRDWSTLERVLSELRGRSAELLDASAGRHQHRLADELGRVVEAQRQALTRPIEESERQLDRLRRSVAGAETSLRDLTALLVLERERFRERFEGWQRQFLAGARAPAMQELEGAIARIETVHGRRVHAPVMDAASAIARARITRWIHDIEPAAQAGYHMVMRHFVELGERFIQEMASSRQVSLGALTAADFGPPVLTVDAQFCFTELLSVASPGFWAWILDTCGPRRWARALATRGAREYLDHLLSTNSMRAANDLVDRVDRSRLALDAEIRFRLGEAVTIAEHALDLARLRQAAGVHEVRAALVRLDGVARDLRALTGPFT